MTVTIPLPDQAALELDHLLLDVNGTLTDRGQLLDGVADRGASSCAAIGNGANDTRMLEAVALGIAVIGPEGASPHALTSADVVCTSITEALDLLLAPAALAATLRR